MSRSSIALAPIVDYAAAHGMQPDAVQQSLIEATTEAAGPLAMMQIGVDQGAFMTVLAATLRPHFAVEVGTFTGYSSLCLARGLAEGGRLLCCDVSEEWTDIARTHWEMAELDDRIDLVLGPATETLAALPAEPRIDLAFIDADKPNYLAYYEAILPRLSDNGLILVDNTLWGGNVLPDAEADDENTVALREFNDSVAADPRVDVAQLTVGDGVTMIRRR
ncbi:MAG: class I SAM-dependent methyltransferase [Acidimicrobiales bacterium]